MKTILALTAAMALMAAPAMAEGIAGGAFGGIAHSQSAGGSFAASGGIAAGGNNGGSYVRNEQSAGQLSGAFASYEGATNGRLTKGIVVTETFTDGFSEARTITRNNGSGTLGAGAGFSANWGDAEAAGAFGGAGWSSNF